MAAVLQRRRPRLLLPRFIPDGDGGSGADGSDGGSGGGIMFPVISFEQTIAPAVVPPAGDPGGTGMGGPFGTQTPQGIMYFNSLAVSGAFNEKFVAIPNDPNLRSCNQLTPPVPDGDSHSLMGGVMTRDPNTGAIIGRLQVGVDNHGTLPGPAGNGPALNALVTAYAYSEAALLAAVQNSGGFIVADRLSVGFTATSFTRLYLGGQGMGAAGYFVNGFMNAIGCPSDALFTYANSFQLVVNPTIFGAPARSQHLTGFVPDGAGGGQYLGTASRINLQFVAPGTTAVYFFKWLVTPDNGDPPYYLTRSEKLTVPPGIPQQLLAEFPPVTGAVVYLDTFQVLFNQEQSEDWSAYAPGETITLGASGSWPFPVQFGGGGTWDNFENFPSGSQYNVKALSTGNWGFPASFSSVDQSAAMDDFENYPVGTINILNHGLGWPEVGGLMQSSPFQALDDFESYAVGPITTLPLTADLFNRWTGAGLMAVVTDSAAWDDFEAYAAGPIPNLPLPADPANHWSAVGTFGF